MCQENRYFHTFSKPFLRSLVPFTIDILTDQVDNDYDPYEDLCPTITNSYRTHSPLHSFLTSFSLSFDLSITRKNRLIVFGIRQVEQDEIPRDDYGTRQRGREEIDHTSLPPKPSMDARNSSSVSTSMSLKSVPNNISPISSSTSTSIDRCHDVPTSDDLKTPRTLDESRTPTDDP